MSEISRGTWINLGTVRYHLLFLELNIKLGRLIDDLRVMVRFTDYKTGKTYTNDDLEDARLYTNSYWQPLLEVIIEYMRHPEAKSMGDENTRGALERRHMVVDEASLHYIGKETNKLEEAEAIGVDDKNYTEYVFWKRGIERLTPEQAESAKISRRNLSYLKKKARDNQSINLKKRTKKCLMRLLSPAEQKDDVQTKDVT